MENNTKDKIDLVAITKTLWKNKRLFGLSCGVAFVIGAVVAFSIPKTYQTKVILAPEVSSGSSMSESLSDIASMMGVNLGKGGSSVDAIYPEIYPQIIHPLSYEHVQRESNLVGWKGERNASLQLSAFVSENAMVG